MRKLYRDKSAWLALNTSNLGKLSAPAEIISTPGLNRHHRTHRRISKSIAKKITMMISSHNILCSFSSVWTTE